MLKHSQQADTHKPVIVKNAQALTADRYAQTCHCKKMLKHSQKVDTHKSVIVKKCSSTHSR
jgi:hypothetical protein